VKGAGKRASGAAQFLAKGAKGLGAGLVTAVSYYKIGLVMMMMMMMMLMMMHSFCRPHQVTRCALFALRRSAIAQERGG
jgi:NAD(P)H-hydrate repair Nnr-like enzyme with NAD(P)H-hydrate dehydratase domain